MLGSWSGAHGGKPGPRPALFKRDLGCSPLGVHPGEKVISAHKRKAVIAAKGTMEEHQKRILSPLLLGEDSIPLPQGQETGRRVRDQPEEESLEIPASGTRSHHPARRLPSLHQIISTLNGEK